MDEAIERLARAAAAGDPESARQLEAALRRAGRRQELEALLWRRLVCPGLWRTRPWAERTCARCGDLVGWSVLEPEASLSDMLELQRRGRGSSVGFSLNQLGRWVDALVHEPGAFAGITPRVHIRGELAARHVRTLAEDFLSQHPDCRSALESGAFELVALELGRRTPGRDHLRRWWPNVVALARDLCSPGKGPCLLLEALPESVFQLEGTGADLAELIGFVTLTFPAFLAPNGAAVDPPQHVLDWCAQRSR